MSNISRRDFLKTAGVMTLAVAAAGVLAGCEGNKPTEPEAPVENVVAIGQENYSIKGAKLISQAKYVVDSKDPSKLNRTEEFRALAVLECVECGANPTAPKLTQGTDYDIKYFINDVQVFHNPSYTFGNADLKDVFGINKTITAGGHIETNEGTLYANIFPISKDVEDNFKAVKSAKVVILNKKNNTVDTIVLDVAGEPVEVYKN